jgi:predicted  nucleic acid-binding Zn-ribbon protein
MNKINNLLELQHSYEEIRRYNKILKDGSHIYLLKKLKKEFEEDKAKFNELSSRLEAIKKELMGLSYKISSEKHILQEHEMRLDRAEAKEHKLMEELLANIEGIKSRIKKFEDESLVLMQEEENFEIEKEKLRIELINIKSNFNIKKEEVNNEIALAQKKIDDLKREVKSLEESLPEDLIKIYREIGRKHENVVAFLEGGMCLGCRMKVSAMTIDELHKSEELVFCNNCGRILFYDKNSIKKAK